MIDTSKILFRCSQLGALNTGSQGKSNVEKYADAIEERDRLKELYDKTPNKLTDTQAKRYQKILDWEREIEALEPIKDVVELGDTCKKALKMIYRELTTGRKQDTSNKYTDKGNKTEDDVITLYSLHKNEFYKKNTIRLVNDFITGETDLYDGDHVTCAEHTIDMKSSWSVWTFPFADDKIEKDYWWQGQGYMALTGANRHTVVYGLVNAPASLIEAEMRKLSYRYFDEKELLKAQIELEKNMIFDKVLFDHHNPGYDWKCEDWTFDIPAKKRLVEFTFDLDENAIAQIELMVPKWREYIASLDK